jgi:hypothetical protein
MAKKDKNGHLKGRLGNTSLYTRKDMPGQELMRTKGGPSEDQIKKGKQFKVVRENIQEFGIRATASSWMLTSFDPLKNLGDYSKAPVLNSMMTALQHADTVSEHGKRSVALTMMPSLIEGMQLSNKNPFEPIVRVPLQYSIDKKTCTATVDIPALVPGVNFFPIEGFGVYRWEAVLGVMPDFIYDEKKKYYVTAGKIQPNMHVHVFRGSWCPSGENSDSLNIELKIPGKLAKDLSFSLILSAGISFGTFRFRQPSQVKGCGCGKVLKVV